MGVSFSGMGIPDKGTKRTTDEITECDIDKNLGRFVKVWTKDRKVWTKPWTEKGTKEAEFSSTLYACACVRYPYVLQHGLHCNKTVTKIFHFYVDIPSMFDIMGLSDGERAPNDTGY